ncbi:MAG TPA: PfkB family carbohydrate kinase [Acidobacteriota bacterium]|nr:PfkB family carbohydrate kinase [Acidobacteriota bacterium]HQM64839.1 PfkB family carbohydrate kinase [Acidobacteriota bacterium]
MDLDKIFIPISKMDGAAFDAVGIGLNAVDRIVTVDCYPALGGKVAFRDERVLPGGQVATAMLAARTLGLPRVRYIGKVGDDAFGRIQLESLAAGGLDTACVRVEPDTPNQSAFIVVDAATGERTIFWQRSERLDFRPGELPPEAYCAAPVLHLDGHDEGMAVECARAARARGILTVLDIDKVRPRSREILPRIDCCISSESFPHALTGEADLERALRGVAALCPGLVAATRGPRGVAGVWRGEYFEVPGYAVRCVDSTGAGDVFHGAFVYALLQGWPLGRMLRFANAAAALNCTAPGARGGLRPAADVIAFMEGKAFKDRR